MGVLSVLDYFADGNQQNVQYLPLGHIVSFQSGGNDVSTLYLENGKTYNWYANNARQDELRVGQQVYSQNNKIFVLIDGKYR